MCFVAAMASIFTIYSDCSFAAQCWSAANLDLVDVYLENFNNWLLSMFRSGDVSSSEKICMVLWTIWTQRNSQLWSNKHQQTCYSVRHALDFLRDFQNAGCLSDFVQSDHSGVSRKKWCSPPVGFVKANIDSAINLQSSTVSFGMVIRNSAGLFLLGRSQ